MLLRHDSWLYRIGGLEGSSFSSASAKMAIIDDEGNMDALQNVASLPQGIHHGVAFSAGNLVYVIGGKTDKGLVSTIYYTYINTDGTLGFGTNGRWESNVIPLPEARAGAAWILHDGWIFLIGGETQSGKSNSIIRARLYQDGQVGQWYKSVQTLPDTLLGAAAAVLDDRLYIAGGTNQHGITSEVISFALGEYGALLDRRIEPDLPLALQEAILLEDRNDLILAGGYDDEGRCQKVYRYHDGIWSDTALTAGAEGSSFGRAGGALFYLPSSDEESDRVVRLDGLSLAPEAPNVIPGSGMVPNKSTILVDGGPGLTVRYRENGGIPTAADPVWPATSIKISATTLPSMELSLASFASDGTASPAVHREYSVRSGSLFVVIEDTLQVHDSGYSGLEYRIMQESGSDGMTPTAASSLWYRIRIDSAGNYRLAWADADEDATFSARLMLSVYEADLYTEVPDLAEIPAHDKRGGQASPLYLALNTGNYFVYIRDIDDQEGRTFGFSLVRE
ncbi:MAG: hypothetical protein WAX33_03130 [Rectinemataceae bacterium]